MSFIAKTGLSIFAMLLMISALSAQTVSAYANTPSSLLSNFSARSTTDDAMNCDPNSTSDTSCNLMVKYINPFIAFLSAFVGVAVTIGIVSGGIKYSSAGSDPGKISAARKQITNSLIALIAFVFLAAALNWVVPGGVL